MGIEERKEREKQKRRNDILNAAEKIFFNKGFDAATMDDVAEEAELSKGTLYLYFKSKEELFHEIARKGEKILEELFANAIKNKKNGLYKVRAIGEAFVKFYTEHHDYHKALLHGHSKKETANKNDCGACEDQKHNSNKIFINTIAEGINDGSIRKTIDPEATSFLLWGQTMGVLQLLEVQGELIEKISGRKPKDFLKYSFDFISEALKTHK